MTKMCLSQPVLDKTTHSCDLNTFGGLRFPFGDTVFSAQTWLPPRVFRNIFACIKSFLHQLTLSIFKVRPATIAYGSHVCSKHRSTTAPHITQTSARNLCLNNNLCSTLSGCRPRSSNPRYLKTHHPLAETNQELTASAGVTQSSFTRYFFGRFFRNDSRQDRDVTWLTIAARFARLVTKTFAPCCFAEYDQGRVSRAGRPLAVGILHPPITEEEDFVLTSQSSECTETRKTDGQVTLECSYNWCVVSVFGISLYCLRLSYTCSVLRCD